jgi:curved DNA-binding protein CbpA
MAPTEISALARILDELDYYQLLHLPRDARPADVKRAYHATSRAFHPDGNRHHDEEVRAAIHQIAKRVTEAYSVLYDPARRKAYDRLRASDGAVRMQLHQSSGPGGHAQADADVAQTPQGRQFFNLAAADLRRDDHAAAVRNLQTALTFEPNNDALKTHLAAARDKLNASH